MCTQSQYIHRIYSTEYNVHIVVNSILVSGGGFVCMRPDSELMHSVCLGYTFSGLSMWLIVITLYGIYNVHTCIPYLSALNVCVYHMPLLSVEGSPDHCVIQLHCRRVFKIILYPCQCYM